MATEAVLAEHPKDVKRLLKVIRDQAAGLMQKKTAPEIIAQRYKMSVDDAREWFSGVRWNTDGQVDLEALARVAMTLMEAVILTKQPTVGLAERLCARL